MLNCIFSLLHHQHSVHKKHCYMPFFAVLHMRFKSGLQTRSGALFLPCSAPIHKKQLNALICRVKNGFGFKSPLQTAALTVFWCPCFLPCSAPPVQKSSCMPSFFHVARNSTQTTIQHPDARGTYRHTLSLSLSCLSQDCANSGRNQLPWLMSGLCFVTHCPLRATHTCAHTAPRFLTWSAPTRVEPVFSRLVFKRRCTTLSCWI